MAKRATMTAAPEDKAIHQKDFQRDMSEINRQKGHATEYNGAAGKLTREAMDRHQLERAAFGFVMRLSKMDESKRQDAIRSSFKQIEATGFLDQIDAFSDLVDERHAVVERLKGKAPKPRQADQVMKQLVN
jgi:hypothetical protein